MAITYSYKGVDYEFPDSIGDDKALELMKADQGETSAQVQPVASVSQAYGDQKSIVPPALTAAAHGLSQGVTLGAGKYATSGIQALIYKMAGGKGKLSDAYDQFLTENNEEEKQLQKEYPMAYGAGEAASFLTPASGANLAFKAGSKLAGAGMRAVPGTMNAIQAARYARTPLGKLVLNATPVAEAAAGAGLASGLQTGIENLNTQQAIDEAKLQALYGGAVPMGGQALGFIGSKAAPAIKEAVTHITGTPWEAMAKYAANPQAIRAASGSEKDLADELVNTIKSVKESNIAEAHEAENMLKDISPANLSRVKDVLIDIAGAPGSKKKAGSPEEQAVIDKLHEWWDYLPQGVSKTYEATPEAKRQLMEYAALNEQLGGKLLTPDELVAAKIGTYTGPEKIPAKQMNELKKSFQDVASKYYGTDNAPAYINAVKGAGHEARQSLLDAAKISGVPEYGEKMATVADKIKTAEQLNSFLGNVLESKPLVAQRMFETLQHKGAKNLEKLATLQKFDEQFGTDFMQQADNAITAKRLGKSGTPALLTQLRTGFANTPLLIGGAAAGSLGYLSGEPKYSLLGILGGALATSPAVWTAGMQTGRIASKAADAAMRAAPDLGNISKTTLGKMIPQDEEQ